MAPHQWLCSNSALQVQLNGIGNPSLCFDDTDPANVHWDKERTVRWQHPSFATIEILCYYVPDGQRRDVS